MPTQQEIDQELTKLCYQLLKPLSLPGISKKLSVTWNTRLRSTAGRAFWPIMRIELNPELKTISAAEVDRTLRHELAHLIAHERNPRRRIQTHGLEWKLACADIGIPGEKATHRLPLKRSQHKRAFEYRCPSCQISFQRVRKMKRAAACLSCCRSFANGKFSSDFLLIETQL